MGLILFSIIWGLLQVKLAQVHIEGWGVGSFQLSEKDLVANFLFVGVRELLLTIKMDEGAFCWDSFERRCVGCYLSALEVPLKCHNQLHAKLEEIWRWQESLLG